MKEAFNSISEIYNRLQACFNLPRGKNGPEAVGIKPVRRDSN